MNEIERALGRLEGSQKAILSALDTLERKVEKLWAFRLQMLGAASVAAFLGGTLMSYLLGIK